jgi:hypothetical protein
MTSIRDDIRSLPIPLAVLVVLVAAVVLTLRIAGLFVVVVVDAAERVEAAITGACGIAPLAASVVLIEAESSR